MLAPSNYLPEIMVGDQTMLNTREYVYASFFVRMKRQMEAVWDPRPALAKHSWARDQYITTVSIVLNEDGSLQEVQILSGSGNRFLDEKAVAAVELASPYLNPPKGIVQADGKIRILPWSFIVTLRPLL